MGTTDMVGDDGHRPFIGFARFESNAEVGQTDGMDAGLRWNLQPCDDRGYRRIGLDQREQDRGRERSALCDLPLDIEAAEFDRRVRAFADGLNGTLKIRLHGRTFKIED